MRSEFSECRDKFDFAVAIIVILWYCTVYFGVRPLTEAPVGDSWVYEHAVTHFNHNGNIQFPGFTQAMPVVQVLYGVAWSRLFGESSRSLDISTVTLAILGGLFFYMLLRECGAARWNAAIATALLICNPCYLFLSFSFMTEVPFLAAVIASYYFFAHAINGSRPGWLWLAGGAAAVGFAIRPFAAAAIAGETAALLATDDVNAERAHLKMTRVVPLLAAMIACAAFWLWLTRLHPKPWMLEYHEQRVWNYFMLVPLREYLARGLLAPAIYLGIVLSPLAVLHALRNWRRSLVLTAAVLGVSITILRLGHEPIWNLERISCFGGSSVPLGLSGVAPHDYPANLYWILAILGAVGFSGICDAWCNVFQNTNCVVRAVLFAAAIYWMAMPLLWFFSDRYDIVLVPAGCLPLAIAPLPKRAFAIMTASLMTAGLAFVSAGGVLSYHRTMQQIVMETQALLRQGIPRQQIDAGYSLSGRDLYVYPRQGMDTTGGEPPIPHIIDSPLVPYVVSTSTIPNMEIWRRFSGCGPFGFGRRPLFVLRATNRFSSPGKER
jgi:hypothetical protein